MSEHKVSRLTLTLDRKSATLQRYQTINGDAMDRGNLHSRPGEESSRDARPLTEGIRRPSLSLVGRKGSLFEEMEKRRRETLSLNRKKFYGSLSSLDSFDSELSSPSPPGNASIFLPTIIKPSTLLPTIRSASPPPDASDNDTIDDEADDVFQSTPTTGSRSIFPNKTRNMTSSDGNVVNVTEDVSEPVTLTFSRRTARYASHSHIYDVVREVARQSSIAEFKLTKDGEKISSSHSIDTDTERTGNNKSTATTETIYSNHDMYNSNYIAKTHQQHSNSEMNNCNCTSTPLQQNINNDVNADNSTETARHHESNSSTDIGNSSRDIQSIDANPDGNRNEKSDNEIRGSSFNNMNNVNSSNSSSTVTRFEVNNSCRDNLETGDNNVINSLELADDRISGDNCITSSISNSASSNNSDNSLKLADDRISGDNCITSSISNSASSNNSDNKSEENSFNISNICCDNNANLRTVDNASTERSKNDAKVLSNDVRVQIKVCEQDILSKENVEDIYRDIQLDSERNNSEILTDAKDGMIDMKPVIVSTSLWDARQIGAAVGRNDISHRLEEELKSDDGPTVQNIFDPLSTYSTNTKSELTSANAEAMDCLNINLSTWGNSSNVSEKNSFNETSCESPVQKVHLLNHLNETDRNDESSLNSETVITKTSNEFLVETVCATTNASQLLSTRLDSVPSDDSSLQKEEVIKEILPTTQAVENKFVNNLEYKNINTVTGEGTDTRHEQESDKVNDGKIRVQVTEDLVHLTDEYSGKVAQRYDKTTTIWHEAEINAEKGAAQPLAASNLIDQEFTTLEQETKNTASLRKDLDIKECTTLDLIVPESVPKSFKPTAAIKANSSTELEVLTVIDMTPEKVCNAEKLQQILKAESKSKKECDADQLQLVSDADSKTDKECGVVKLQDVALALASGGIAVAIASALMLTMGIGMPTALLSKSKEAVHSNTEQNVDQNTSPTCNESIPLSTNDSAGLLTQNIAHVNSTEIVPLPSESKSTVESESTTAKQTEARNVSPANSNGLKPMHEPKSTLTVQTAAQNTYKNEPTPITSEDDVSISFAEHSTNCSAELHETILPVNNSVNSPVNNPDEKQFDRWSNGFELSDFETKSEVESASNTRNETKQMIKTTHVSTLSITLTNPSATLPANHRNGINSEKQTVNGYEDESCTSHSHNAHNGDDYKIREDVTRNLHLL